MFNRTHFSDRDKKNRDARPIFRGGSFFAIPLAATGAGKPNPIVAVKTFVLPIAAWRVKALSAKQSENRKNKQMKTRKHGIGSLIAVSLVGVFVSFSAPSGKAQPPVKDGWWIRIDPQKTEASTISFQIGPNRLDRKDWWTWKSGQFVEFDLPPALRNAPRLYIRGITEPHNKHAWFCVFYRGHGVKHFKFDGDEDHNLKQGESDHDCTP